MKLSLMDEIRAIRGGGAIYCPEGLGHIRIEGPEVAPFLQRIVTNDVIVPVGGGCHAAILDRKGMVRSLFYLAKVGESSYHLMTLPQLKEKTLDILTKLKLREPIEIRDVSGEWGYVRIIGPKVLPPTLPFLLTKEEGNTWRDNFYKVPVWNIVYQVGAGGEGRAQDRSPSLVLPHLWGEERKEGGTVGNEPGPAQVSKMAFDILRMESGIPEYGVDIDETTILLEANLPHTYKRFKGCYPGQEVIERILAYGKGRTPRTLCALYIEGDHKIPPMTEIFTESGEKAGFITSALFNPLDRRTVLLGYLNHKYSEGVHEIRESVSRFILVT